MRGEWNRHENECFPTCDLHECEADIGDRRRRRGRNCDYMCLLVANRTVSAREKNNWQF